MRDFYFVFVFAVILYFRIKFREGLTTVHIAKINVSHIGTRK